MNAPIPAPRSAPALRPAVKPPSIALLGDPGSGKTYAITTLIECGLEVFVLVTEANGADTLMDSMRARKLPLDKLHWHFVQPVSVGWDAMDDMARKINLMSYDDLSKMKTGIDKENCRQFIEVLKSVQNFPCDRTGELFGDVTTWGDNRAFVLDSLTGLNEMAMQLTIGLKPTAHQGEWGVAMNLEMQFINTLCSSLNCFFIMTAHVDREPNEIEGSTEKTMSALGRKNAPKIARLFSEIVLSKRGPNGTFVWSTAEPNTVLKQRALTFGGQLFPSFKSIFDVHQKRLAEATSTNKE